LKSTSHKTCSPPPTHTLHPYTTLFRSCYEDMHQHKRAIEDYDEAIRLDPKNADAYNNRGAVYKRLGQNKSAIESYTQALEADPRSEEHTSELQSPYELVCRLLLEKKNG